VRVLNRVLREVTVSLLRQSLPLLVAAWFAAMIGVIGTSVAVGLPVTGAGMAGWVLLGCIPPVVLLKVFRGPGPATMSQVMSGVTLVPAPNVRTVRNNAIGH
jgi:hypothetical protein